MLILLKIARNFGGKIQLYVTSVKKIEKNPPLYLAKLTWHKGK